MTQQSPSCPLGGEVVRTGPPGEVDRPGRACPIPHRPWTGQDSVWWHIAAILTATRQDHHPDPVSPTIDFIRPALRSGGIMLATCDAKLLMRRRGDAVYSPSRGLFLTDDPVGPALTAAFFGEQTYLNHRQRHAAEVGAAEKWCHLVGTRLNVSTCGIYLGTGRGVMPISCTDIQEVQFTATGEVVVAATDTFGSTRLKIRAQWAELVPIPWPMRYVPKHPQLVRRTWTLGNWPIHAAARGHDVDTTPWSQTRPALP